MAEEKKEIGESSIKPFEDIRHVDKEGKEYWFARDLKGVLGYDEWRNFTLVIEKAKISIGNGGGQDVNNHFVDVNKMVKLGSGSERGVPDIMLTRYACYLIAQNGNPQKKQIALAQSYFAIQSRKQEIMQGNIKLIKRVEARKLLTETEKRFAHTLWEREVDGRGIASIRAKGDKALFGGYTTREMKNRLGISQNKPLADYLPTVSITAKNLASEMTIVNTENKDLRTEIPIAKEHAGNNASVRNVLIDKNIIPEKLPAEEDVKKLKRKYDKEIEKIEDKSIAS